MAEDTAPYALVVDDDMVRMAAAEILEEAGLRTSTAHDGDDALELMAENHASIVLLFTDVQMPGSRDGFAHAREVAATWLHVAIVVASGATEPGLGDMPEGARFIGKPFPAEMIRARVEELLPDAQQPKPLRHG